MLYIHATIITVNPSREIILNGAILVQGNLIAAIDKTDVLTKMYPAEEIIDLVGRIIIPGLISTHMHTAQTLLRGELCLNLIIFLLFVTNKPLLITG
jgi:cytosine/adenosine deaminase-related metal-dependent hydrolase